VADAVILADNQRYMKEETPISANFDEINQRLVDPFYNLLCAGEEVTPRFVGSKVLDAGDIIQTLSGWSVIGHSTIRGSRLPFHFGPDFRGKHAETQRGIRAMDEALAELPLKCRPKDSRRALYLLTSAPGRMSMEIIKELAHTLKERAPEAIIRSGDYPRTEVSMDITVVLSELVNVGKIVDYFDKTISYVNADRARAGEVRPDGGAESFKDIPSLFD
jgi:cell division GTPase FtsZ